MSRNHVYRLANGELVLDLQANTVDTGSRVVAPLVPADQDPGSVPRLQPIVEIDGRRYRVRTDALGAVKTRSLSQQPVADLSARHSDIQNALDMLFLGY